MTDFATLGTTDPLRSELCRGHCFCGVEQLTKRGYSVPPYGILRSVASVDGPRSFGEEELDVWLRDEQEGSPGAIAAHRGAGPRPAADGRRGQVLHRRP